MRLVKLLFLGLVFAATVRAFPLWLDRPKHTNPVDPAYSGPAILPSPTPQLQPLVVHMGLYTGTVPVAGAQVVLGNDVANPVVTNASGDASFSAVRPPVDVHIYSPLSGSSPLFSPSVISVFGVTSTSVTLNGYSPLTYTVAAVTQYNVYTMISGVAGTSGSYCFVAQPPSFSFGGSSSGLFNSAGSSARPGQRVNIAYTGWDNTSVTTCAYFHPQFVMGASDITVAATASTTGFQLLHSTLSLATTWPSYKLYSYVGTNANNYYRVGNNHYSDTFLGGVPVYLTVTAPSGAGYFVFNTSTSYFYANSETRSAQIYQRISGALPASVNLALPGQFGFQVPYPSATNTTIRVSSPAGLMGPANWLFSVANWVGIKSDASVLSQAVTIPNGLPAGYPSNFLATGGQMYSVQAMVSSMNGDYSGAVQKTISSW